MGYSPKAKSLRRSRQKFKEAPKTSCNENGCKYQMLSASLQVLIELETNTFVSFACHHRRFMEILLSVRALRKKLGVAAFSLTREHMLELEDNVLLVGHLGMEFLFGAALCNARLLDVSTCGLCRYRIGAYNSSPSALVPK